MKICIMTMNIKVVKLRNISNYVPDPKSQFVPINEQNNGKKYKKNKYKNSSSKKKNNWKLKYSLRQPISSNYYPYYSKCDSQYYQHDYTPNYYFTNCNILYDNNNFQYNYFNQYNFNTYMKINSNC